MIVARAARTAQIVLKSLKRGGVRVDTDPYFGATLADMANQDDLDEAKTNTKFLESADCWSV